MEKGELHAFQNRDKKFIISFISFAGTLLQDFGTSTGFLESAAHALEGKTTRVDNLCKSLDLEAANQVASCGYERNTAWDKKVHTRNYLQIKFSFLGPIEFFNYTKAHLRDICYLI